MHPSAVVVTPVAENEVPPDVFVLKALIGLVASTLANKNIRPAVYTPESAMITALSDAVANL